MKFKGNNDNLQKNKISVVMCTYNGEKYLRQQLDSILSQSLLPYEILVQDDFSTDNTWNILQEYAYKHSQIKLFRNRKSLGVDQNFLQAFFKTQGDYIAVSDQDDVWVQRKLEICLKSLLFGDYTMVYADDIITDENLKVIGQSNIKEFNLPDIIWMGVAPGHSMFFRKDILLSIKNLDSIDFTYDWLINIVSICNGKIKKLDVPLVHWRRHNSTITNYNYQAPEVEYRSPLNLFIHVVFYLEKPLKNFLWQFENIYLILKNFGHVDRVQPFLGFLKYYKRESFLGLFFSSYLYSKIEKADSLRTRLSKAYFPIYRYYYYQRDGFGLRG